MINFFKKLINTISRRSFGRTIEYSLGRFRTVRSLRQFYLKNFDKSDFIYGNNRNFIKHLNSKEVIYNLKKKGLHEGLQLNDKTIKKFNSFIYKSKTVEHGNLKRKISTNDALKYNAKKPSDPILVLDHQSKELNNFSNTVARSKTLLEIAEKYLGKVKKIQTKVQTSLVADAGIYYREDNGQTVTFHYDVEGFNFVYIFFYLSDCDKYSGAHESILYSHNFKKLKHLFSSACQSEENIYSTYKGKNKVIEGKVGFGFVEDTSCFHRAIAPLFSKRVCFQIRYVG